MRRMLDPKELGGGESTAKLYKHHVSLSSSGFGKVEITIYNYNDIVIDSETKLKDAMKSIGRVIATGYYFQSASVFNVYSAFFNYSDEKAYAAGYYNDTSSGKTSTSSITLDYHFNSFKDDVKEVS